MVRKVFIFLLMLVLCRGAFAAFTFDTSAESGATSNANPVTLTYTCGANAKLLVLNMSILATAVRTGGNPTYNGVTMTQAGSRVQGAAEVTTEMWFLSNPETGSALTISVPNTLGQTMRLMASSFITPELGAGLDMVTTSNTTAANPSISITPMQDNTVIVNAFSDGNTTVPSANNRTLLYKNDNGSWSNNGQYTIQATKAAIAFTWTVASDDVANILAAFRESVGTVIQGDSYITGTSVTNGK